MVESATFSPDPVKTRSLYIHIPFCRHRCGYCNFALLADRDELIDRYLDALAIEIGWLKNRPKVSTVFVGGGTPSLLSQKQLATLTKLIRTRFEVSSDAEMTIECNPDDVSFELCVALKDAGFNRVSLGVQSFHDAKLKLLDRQHSSRQTKLAITEIKHHFDNISFDLIFAAQAEQSHEWLDDLDAAIEFQPVHLSAYELTIEKGTMFWNQQYHGSLVVPDEDARADLFEATISRLTKAGFGHYEISSFASPGSECRHNQTYWNGSDYMAFGASAARFVDSIRETNHRSATTYMKRVFADQSPVYEHETVSDQDLILERIAFGLRQIEGIDWMSIENASIALPADFKTKLSDKMNQFRSMELLADSHGKCRLTSRGLFLYDSIASQILALGHGGV